MDNGVNEDFKLLFNGEGFPDVRTYKATGLITGLSYRFYVQAVNIIGKGSPSPPAFFYSCADPSGVEAP